MSEKFNYVKKGYDPAEVDPYIQGIEDVLKSYKEKDSAIKNAFINAQLAADNIVKNAELEAEKIKAKAISHIDKIIKSVDDQKKFVREFQEDYNSVIQRYVKEINEIEINKLNAKIQELEDYVHQLKDETTEK